MSFVFKVYMMFSISIFHLFHTTYNSTTFKIYHVVNIFSGKIENNIFLLFLFKFEFQVIFHMNYILSSNQILARPQSMYTSNCSYSYVTLQWMATVLIQNSKSIFITHAKALAV